MHDVETFGPLWTQASRITPKRQKMLSPARFARARVSLIGSAASNALRSSAAAGVAPFAAAIHTSAPSHFGRNSPPPAAPSSASSQQPGSAGDAAGSAPNIHTSEVGLAAARLLFDAVWRDVVAQRGGLEKMTFPSSIVWLTGAPGAGKGTMGSLVMKERDIAQLFEVSSILNSPTFRNIKEAGLLIGDRDVIQAVILELLKPEFTLGVVVDGFPRTTIQAQCIRLLRDKLQDLWSEHRNHPELRRIFRRPNFSIACFYCSEEESVRRQLLRGEELSRLNRIVNETGVGNVADVRATDVSPEAARRRYKVFRDEVYASLQAIKDHLPFHFVNADGTPEQVKKQLMTEFAYQSQMDLTEESYELVRSVEPANLITKQARTLLMTRLNSYAVDYKDLAQQVVQLLNSEFMHIIKRQSLAGRAIIRSQNPLLNSPICVNMVLDILAERGYTCVLDVLRSYVPVRVEPTVIGDTNGPKIVNRVERTFIFTITFPKPEIRKAQH